MTTLDPSAGLVKRVAIVTGGASGIGRAIVEELASSVIADVNEQAATAVALAGTVMGHAVQSVATDIGDEAAVVRLVEQTISAFGRIDILVNTARVELYRRAGEYTSADWDRPVGINLKGAFLRSRYALPHLLETRGSIVNIASVQAIANEMSISVFVASKAGMLLTRLATPDGPG